MSPEQAANYRLSTIIYLRNRRLRKIKGDIKRLEIKRGQRKSLDQINHDIKESLLFKFITFVIHYSQSIYASSGYRPLMILSPPLVIASSYASIACKSHFPLMGYLILVYEVSVFVIFT